LNELLDLITVILSSSRLHFRGNKRRFSAFLTQPFHSAIKLFDTPILAELENAPDVRNYNVNAFN
jgi:hypothetical protein